MLQPEAVKTWTKFQSHFTLASRDRKNISTTTQGAGYHTVGNAIDDITTNGTTSEISTLAEVITVHILSNTNDFRDMLTILKFNSLQSGVKHSPTENRFKSKYYCWTHRRSYNRDHTSATCDAPVDGHQTTATWRSKLKGTDRDTTTPRN